MKERIYISGPMTGIKENNFPMFILAEKFLKGLGYIPVSPHRVPKQKSYQDYMREGLKLLCTCKAIAMLPGWEESNGARIEKIASDSMGNKVYYINIDDDSISMEYGL